MTTDGNGSGEEEDAVVADLDDHTVVVARHGGPGAAADGNVDADADGDTDSDDTIVVSTARRADGPRQADGAVAPDSPAAAGDDGTDSDDRTDGDHGTDGGSGVSRTESDDDDDDVTRISSRAGGDPVAEVADIAAGIAAGMGTSELRKELDNINADPADPGDGAHDGDRLTYGEDDDWRDDGGPHDSGVGGRVVYDISAHEVERVADDENDAAADTTRLSIRSLSNQGPDEDDDDDETTRMASRHGGKPAKKARRTPGVTFDLVDDSGIRTRDLLSPLPPGELPSSTRFAASGTFGTPTEASTPRPIPDSVGQAPAADGTNESAPRTVDPVEAVLTPAEATHRRERARRRRLVAVLAVAAGGAAVLSVGIVIFVNAIAGT